MAETYQVAAVQDSQWEKTKDYYAHIVKNCDLRYISDFIEYIQAIKDQNYSVFISVGDEASAGLTNEMMEALQDLGLKTDWSNKYRWGYYAVILPGEAIMEEVSEDTLTVTGRFRDN